VLDKIIPFVDMENKLQNDFILDHLAREEYNVSLNWFCCLSFLLTFFQCFPINFHAIAHIGRDGICREAGKTGGKGWEYLSWGSMTKQSIIFYLSYIITMRKMKTRMQEKIFIKLINK
jgi:hypothetical protein